MWMIFIGLQVLKDRHLIAVTIVVTGITILLLLLETSVPYLRGNVSQEIDQEHPTGRTVSLLHACTL